MVYGEDASSQVLRETELREAAEQLAARKELERLDHLKDEFLALASHELRTPLVPLQGYLQMLLKVLPSDEAEPRLREYANIALSQARHYSGSSRESGDRSRLRPGREADHRRDSLFAGDHAFSQARHY